MRGLIILCFVAVVCAEELGYEYELAEHSDEGPKFASDIQNFKQTDDSITVTPVEMPIQNDFDFETPVPQPAVLSSEFTKEFYSFDAPEDGLDDNEINKHITSSLKKSLRVVFIKGPENQGFEKAVLNLAKQASQQHTDIYVLSKQADIGTLADQFQNVKSRSQSTPEVHFVKYRTPQDAANAQKAIQDQYNSLPGTAQQINGGEASVLNFASRAPIASGHIPAGPGHQYLPANPIPSSTNYLPPSLRRFRL